MEVVKEMVHVDSEAQAVQRAINAIIDTEDARGLNFCEKVELIESVLKQYDQVEIPVEHTFLGGIYIRKILIPKGTLMTSRYHKYDQMDVMVYGDMSIASNSGTIRMKGPFTGISRPGMKRIGYAHEDTLWLDIHQTEETDIPTLEKMLFSDNYKDISHLVDREDYGKMLIECGFTEEIARMQSENEGDQIAISLDDYGLTVGDSLIEGRGLFATGDIATGEIIAPARIKGCRTQAGRFTNHSLTPNAEMVLRSDGDIDLVAARDITHEEITIDYRDALALSGIRAEGRKIACQQ